MKCCNLLSRSEPEALAGASGSRLARSHDLLQWAVGLRQRRCRLFMLKAELANCAGPWCVSISTKNFRWQKKDERVSTMPSSEIFGIMQNRDQTVIKCSQLYITSCKRWKVTYRRMET